ncbi:hypothetical protein [Pseudomonas sp. TTU2014-080ASC]|uniref:hypothetical protein n=1 Tax=Pseudomonas sp. TTU2014-080ASC TaxID=1729724 RepID=UPI00071863D9|nr:hypothetical protein [Pseudomonas sp. TTU2014-080ASC]KRW58896.1 hypothetical protein AO726_15400 [Pseudomonas sp. TTU2014-080ASC]
MFSKLMRFTGCFVLGLVLAVILLVVLMFFGQFDLIKLLQLSGQPLAQLGLMLMPDGFWNSLSGTANASSNPHVQSFLSLCTALGQVGLLLAAGFYRLWYRP